MSGLWKVRIVEGGETSASITLKEGKEAVLGRDPAADLVLTERSVSRRHCRLRGTADGVHVLDLGSANGVYFGGRRVKEALLKPGEEAQIGLARLVVGRTTAQTGMIPITGLDESESMAAPPSGPSSPESQPGVPLPTVDAAPGDHTALDTGSEVYKNLEKERLALLVEAGKSLASARDVGNLLERVMDQLFQLLPVKRGVLALLTPEGELDARYTRPRSEEKELSAYCSQHIIRDVIESRKGRIIEDASIDQAFNTAQSILISDVKAAICVPLLSHTRTIGAVYADFPGRARLYTQADLDFLGAFASFAAVTIENARMQEELRERERLQRDLEIAAEIQQGILPSGEFASEGLDVDWAYWPAKQIGGDFYDCWHVDENRVGLVLGDVSGKSIGAALFMSRLMSALRAIVGDDPSPARVLTHTNVLLPSREGRQFFATAAYCLVDHREHSLVYASAGHNPPLLLPPDTDEFQELPATGMPLGILDDHKYQERKLDLPQGSLLILYTDGIVEARDTEGEQFGLDATKELILAHRYETPKEITAALIETVACHCRASPYVRDDIALMVVRV